MLDVMIFSKNRPLQLDCLLTSLEKLTNIEMKNVYVLHKYEKEFKEGLNILKDIHKDVNFIEEDNFESQVKLFLMNGQKFCTFFVDDIIIKEEIDYRVPCNVLENNPQVLTFSFRLGTHLTYCYPVSSSQPVPNGNINSQFFVWDWRKSPLDWGYPFSLDGHIFRRSEFEGWSSHLKFSNPNQFESELQKIPKIYKLPELACCYLLSRAFNAPLNRVQDEFKNRNEGMSVEDLYSEWMRGKKIDSDSLVGFINRAAHHPVSISLKDRS